MERITTKMPVPFSEHQRVELIVRHAQQALTVAAFHGDDLIGFELVDDDGLDVPSYAESRHGTVLAVCD